ncbi:MAG: response regulator transcription factor [Proteobacteria bacterium]|nr:response regulator transcription factor [Pseudomonadota bacterium]
MRILLVEDDVTLGQVVRQSLLQTGHRVDLAVSGAQARHLWQVQPVDAVLLDLNLPDENGLTLLREARARGDRTPVIVLTARNRTEERIAGLDAGADDYLGKPFDLGEVEARLRALVRRAGDGQDVAEVGGLVFDRRAGRFFTRQGDGSVSDLAFPSREFAVLAELMTPPGKVVAKRFLSDKLAGFDDALGDNAIEVFISRLRRKLIGSGATIRTFRGLGYALETDAEQAV